MYTPFPVYTLHFFCTRAPAYHILLECLPLLPHFFSKGTWGTELGPDCGGPMVTGLPASEETSRFVCTILGVVVWGWQNHPFARYLEVPGDSASHCVAVWLIPYGSVEVTSSQGLLLVSSWRFWDLCRVPWCSCRLEQYEKRTGHLGRIRLTLLHSVGCSLTRWRTGQQQGSYLSTGLTAVTAPDCILTPQCLEPEVSGWFNNSQ